MVKLLDKDLVLLTNDISDICDKEAQIKKSTDGFYTLTLTVYPVDLTKYNNIKNGNIIEIENDYYVINDVKSFRNIKERKTITATQILDETRRLYWENDFEIVNPIDWEENKRMISGLFYIYDTITYLCNENHVSTAIFDMTKFEDVTGKKSNFMPDVNPKQVLDALFENTNWTILAGDELLFSTTDFTIKRGSLYENLQEIKKTWGCELEVNKRTIKIKEKIGSNKTAEFAYMKNNVNLSKTENIDNIINRLYIYGTNGLTLESIQTDKFLEDLTSINEYGLKTAEVVFTNISDVNFLKQRGLKELEMKKNPEKIIDVEVIDTNNQDGNIFDIGDVVYVDDVGIGEVMQQYRIINISYNPFEKKLFSMTLGSNTSNIVQIFKKIVKNYKDLNTKLDDKIENIASNERIIQKILEVVQMETFSAENAHILNAWIKNLFVELVETNMDAVDARNTTPPPERNFIELKDQDIKLYSQNVDPLTKIDLMIPNPDHITGGMVNVYYTAIGTDPDAYKYFTITHPQVLHPELTAEEVENYKVKIYNTTNKLAKMQIGFLDGNSNYPFIVWGAGSGTTEWSHKVAMYKTENTFNIVFYNDLDEETGMQINNQYVAVKNNQPQNGGGHVSNSWYGTAEPDNLLGLNGDVYYKLKP